MADGYHVVADTKDSLSFSWTGTGAPTASDFTSIALKITRPDGTSISKSATIDSSSPLTWHFAWAATDLQAGTNLAELFFTYTSGDTLTLPNADVGPLQIIARGRLA